MNSKIIIGILFYFLSFSVWSQDIRPNVILILVDDLGWSDIGCNGNEYYETPYIDTLAKQSIFFTNASVSSPYADEVQKSILNGCFPVNHSKQKASDLNLPEAFKRKGYELWHIGAGIGDGNPVHQKEFQNFDAIVSGRDQKNHKDPATLISQAKEIIQSKESGPFFLNLWFYSRKGMKTLDSECIEYFQDKAIDKGWTDLFSREIWCPGLYEDMPVHTSLEHLKMPEDANYATYLKSLDKEIGHLLEYLKQTEEYENTIIVFTTDDGGECDGRYSDCNRPLRGAAGDLYEGGVRVPLFIHIGSSHRIGQRCNQVVILEDIFPTLGEICDLPVHSGQCMDGLSLAEVLKHKCEVKRDAVFWHFKRKDNQQLVSAIRCCEWKYIYNHTLSQSFLFHLGKDMGENMNINKKFPLKVACMQRKLNAWFASVHKEELILHKKGVTDKDCEE